MEFFDRPKKHEGVRNKHFLTIEQVETMRKAVWEHGDLRIDTIIA